MLLKDDADLASYVAGIEGNELSSVVGDGAGVGSLETEE
jgi:hypothetical protein